MGKLIGLCGKYRYFMLVLSFFHEMCLQMISRNLVFALPGMINHTYVAQKASSEDKEASQGSCAPNGTDAHSPGLTAVPDGPFPWDSDRQTLLLGIPSFGMVVGTLTALIVYDYCFLRPIISTTLIWGGLLNILAPEITKVGRSDGLIIARFAIGIYCGLVAPAPNVICDNWFTAQEKNVALTISYTGVNVGAILFALAGEINSKLGWEANFRIPGAISVFCGVLFLVFYTDDPAENLFIGEEEAKLLKVPWTKPTDSPLSKASKDNQMRHVKRFHEHSGFLTAMTTIHVARHEPRKRAPLLKALTYSPIWAVLCGAFGAAWSYESVTTYTQFYLIEMHNFSLSKTSVLNAM